MTRPHETPRPGDPFDRDARAGEAGVDLYWLPLGAGGRFVRFNGRVYEKVASRFERRPAFDLYHSALEITVESVRYVIEMTPVSGNRGVQREVVAEGAVGAGWAGRLRIFRYEIRRWRNGQIPDVDEAVGSPVRLSSEAATAGRLFEMVPEVPTLVWGRDELGTGDMWNSNSVISWLLASGGLDVARIRLPEGGRAPGWLAGIEAAGDAGTLSNRRRATGSAR